MTEERWRRIEEIYHAACNRAASERRGYIEETCGTDHDLRWEVESLLQYDDSSSNLCPNCFPCVESDELAGAPSSRAPGTQLDRYQIECMLGAGGMGEVFRGRDTRLNRAVAIKILRKQFVDRFEREAQAISSLNHPNICTLYDVGPNFLVMELLEGVTLAARLKAGPLAIDVACQYGLQIASALAGAHNKGLIHRDLKPGNIMLTKAGVKVFDFGLAKGTEGQVTTDGPFGTPAYMAPEQFEGKPCDHRTDIYSFGLILREMTSANDGASTPLAEIADRCLRIDPNERWQSASDIAAALELLHSAPSVRPVRRPRSWRGWLIPASLLGLLIAIAAWKVLLHRTAPPPMAKLALTIPEESMASDPGALIGPPAISRDGTVVVLPLSVNGSFALWMRRLDSDHFERLEGTQGNTRQPFWSPDGTQIAFFAEGKLKKMKLPHGPPEILCDVPTETARGGAWSSKGVILFGVNYKGLMKIPESGGDPVLVEGVDASMRENSLRFPQFLDDGNRFIYFSRTFDSRNRGVYLEALDSAGKHPRKRLVPSDGPAVAGYDPYSKRNFLVFPKGGQLWAQPFDESSGSLPGEKVLLSDDVGQFSLSASGVLVYRPAVSEQNRLSWVDRSGKLAGPVGQPGDYFDLSISPDQRYVAVLNHKVSEGHFWVETIDLARNQQSPLSDTAGRVSGLVWSRDSQNLYFTAWDEKESRVLVRRMNSAAPARVVVTSKDRYQVRSLFTDGRTLIADHWIGLTEQGLAFLPNGKPPWKLYEALPATLARGQFSPDGKWLLYESNESGRREVYLSDYPNLRSRRQISVSGGTEPRWGHDGKEIFYVTTENVLVSIPIRQPIQSTFGDPKVLFRLPGHVGAGGGFSYDVSGDGARFLVLSTKPPPNARDLTVVLNWPQLMASRPR